jgi:hypothetical protein
MLSLKFTATYIFIFASLMMMAWADIIAWGGDHCDGGEGADVACDGRCNDFSNRHSFSVSEVRCASSV